MTSDAAVSTPEAPREARIFVLPRGVVILLGLAAAVITIAGVRSVATIIAPIFMALVLTITAYPMRTWLQRHGVPSWLATLIVVLVVYALLIGLVVAFIIGVARLAALLPDYKDQMQSTIDDIKSWLSTLGIGATESADIGKNISPGKIVEFVGGILGGALNVVSGLVFVITLVLFMGIDSAVFTTRADRFRGGRAQALSALSSFALGTRKYFAVSTVFGGIVAVLDFIALIVLGVPAAFLWGLLAFVTNYIPNIGFIIGLIPPALLALLAGGVSKMVIVIVVYVVLNFVIQSVLQPKFVGDAVGLTTTVSFLSLIAWSYVLGPLGAILAVPTTLLVKSLFVDVDPDARWLQLFLGDAPVFRPKGERRRRRRHTDEPADPAPAPVSSGEDEVSAPPP